MKDYRLYAFVGLIFAVLSLVVVVSLMLAIGWTRAGMTTLAIGVSLSLILGGLPNFLINGKIF